MILPKVGVPGETEKRGKIFRETGDEEERSLRAINKLCMINLGDGREEASEKD